MNSGRCQDVQARLSEFLDRELPEQTGGRIQAHLEGCAGCQAELDELRQLRKVLRTASVPSAEEGFWDGLTATASRSLEARRRPARRWALPVALALSSCLAVTLATRFALPPAPREQAAIPDDADVLIAQHAQHSSAYPLADWATLSYIDAQEDARSTAFATSAEPHP